MGVLLCEIARLFSTLLACRWSLLSLSLASVLSLVQAARRRMFVLFVEWVVLLNLVIGCVFIAVLCLRSSYVTTFTSDSTNMRA